MLNINPVYTQNDKTSDSKEERIADFIAWSLIAGLSLAVFVFLFIFATTGKMPIVGELMHKYEISHVEDTIEKAYEKAESEGFTDPVFVKDEKISLGRGHTHIIHFETTRDIDDKRVVITYQAGHLGNTLSEPIDLSNKEAVEKDESVE